MSQELFFAVTAWFFISFCLGVYEHLPDLRHTFATLSLKSGVDMKTLSSSLGHYSAGFTLSTYTHATPDMMREAADTMGEGNVSDRAQILNSVSEPYCLM